MQVDVITDRERGARQGCVLNWGRDLRRATPRRSTFCLTWFLANELPASAVGGRAAFVLAARASDADGRRLCRPVAAAAAASEEQAATPSFVNELNHGRVTMRLGLRRAACAGPELRASRRCRLSGGQGPGS